jgi:hypothetical protein
VLAPHTMLQVHLELPAIVHARRAPAARHIVACWVMGSLLL